MSKKLTPMRAIRARCLDCSAGSTYEVRECLCIECSLYPYRYGKRPSTVKKNAQTPSKLTVPGKISPSQPISEEAIQ